MNASIRPLSESQAKEIYQLYLINDFPPDERKPWLMIQRRLRKNAYRCLGLFEGDSLRGYAFIALNGDQEALLDYFAVLNAWRDQGYGSLFLKMLMNRTADSGWMLVEAENPSAALSPETLAIREKRLRFYLKNGLVDTGARALVFGVNYVLLSFPKANLSTKNAARVYAALYRSFLPAVAYKKWVRIEDKEERKDSENE